MKKINANTNNFVSLELRAQNENRYKDEKFKSLVAKPEGWTEVSGYNLSGTKPTWRKRLGQLHAIEAWALGKYMVDEYFHLYTDTSEILLTKCIGLVSSRHPMLVAAQAKGLASVSLTVPEYGLMWINMPFIWTPKGKEYLTTSPWLSLSMDGKGKGDLYNTDTDVSEEQKCAYLHNTLEELYRGNTQVVMITFDRTYTGEIKTTVYDEAIRIYEIITSKNFDPKAIMADKKAVAIGYKENSHLKNLGKIQEEEAQKSGTNTDVTNVMAVINGEEMDCLTIPGGTYMLTSAAGKKFGQQYPVRNNGDRRGLSNKVDPETGKVFLVQIS
jgi:hypothetical protein